MVCHSTIDFIQGLQLPIYRPLFTWKTFHKVAIVVKSRHLFQRPQVIVLKEGTEASQGKSQVVSNINACQVVAEAVRTTLGPRGMDKLMVDGNGKGYASL